MELNFNKVQSLKIQNFASYFPFIFMIIMMLFFRRIFMFSVFVLIDLFCTYFNRMSKIKIPLDALTIGAILFSFSGQIIFALMLGIFVVISRIILGTLESRHLIKPLIIAAFSFFAAYFSRFEFFFAFVISYLFRYIIEYAIDAIIFGELVPKRIFQRMLNFFGGIIFISIFGNFVLINII